MANLLSKNVVNDVTNVLVNTQTNLSSECFAVVSQSNNTTCTNVNSGGSFVINQTNNAGGPGLQQINVSCFQTTVNSTEVTNNLEETINQLAKQSAASISLSSAEADNLTQLVRNLSTNIQSSISSTCATQISQANALNCNGITVPQGDVLVNQANYTSLLFNCVQNTDNVITAQNKIVTAISQSTDQVQQDLLRNLAILGGVVAVIIALVIFGPELAGGGSFAIIIFFIVALIILYLILAYVYSIWPFNSSSQ